MVLMYAHVPKVRLSNAEEFTVVVVAVVIVMMTLIVYTLVVIPAVAPAVALPRVVAPALHQVILVKDNLANVAPPVVAQLALRVKVASLVAVTMIVRPAILVKTREQPVRTAPLPPI
jgi:hypothetical protein